MIRTAFTLLAALLVVCGQQQPPTKSAPKVVTQKIPNDTSPYDAGMGSCNPEQDLGMADLFTSYACDPKTKRWVVNVKGMEWAAKEEARKSELFWALQSRILTDAEMAEVAKQGTRLLIHHGQSYREEDIQKQMNEALLQQFRLRAVAASPNSPCKDPRPQKRDGFSWHCLDGKWGDFEEFEVKK